MTRPLDGFVAALAGAARAVAPSRALSLAAIACSVGAATALGAQRTGAAPASPATTTSVTAYVGMTLIDGTGRTPVAGAIMLVRDGRVVAVGSEAAVRLPANVTRVSLAGKTVIPGLVNTHGHVTAPSDLSTYAAYGVTTVFSLGDEPASVFAARESQEDGSLARARVYVAGPVLNPSSAAEARQQVADLAARNVDIVKIRVDDNLGATKKMAPAVYRAVIDEAHRRGKRVAVHLYYLADARAVLDAGADFIAHSVRDSLVDGDFTRMLAAKQRVCYTPTLMREVSTFVYESTPAFFGDSLFLSHANREWVAALRDPARQEATRTSRSAQTYKAQLPVAMRNLKTLFDAGVPIGMGTDTGPMGRFQGYFELMELEQMVEAGLTPAQALAAATSVAARCIGADRELGTLAQGKRADFVVLDASPLERISNVRRISAVYVAGNRVMRRRSRDPESLSAATVCADQLCDIKYISVIAPARCARAGRPTTSPHRAQWLPPRDHGSSAHGASSSSRSSVSS